MDSRKRQQGFTLIEIIAVIVLLGVLAAVLVPRFTNIIGESRSGALQQAVAEGQARVNQAAASFILDQGKVPSNYAALAAVVTLNTDAGDFDLAFGAGAADSEVNITAGYTHTGSTETVLGRAFLPQSK